MKILHKLILNYLIVASAIFSLIVITLGQNNNQINLIEHESITKDISTNVCENNKRLKAFKDLLIAKGAKEENIKDEINGDVQNVILTKKGKSDEIIIIGAHYDNLNSCGVIDNWTGIVILANIYTSIINYETNKTIKFVAFDKEEQGLIGSRKMAKSIAKKDRIKYCSMLNFDSFGLATPQAMGNTSNEKLIKTAEQLAKKMNMSFGMSPINDASSDSVSFNSVNIPAITFHGMNDNWKNYLHTSKDSEENINSLSVYLGYRFGLAFLVLVDSQNCDAHRNTK